MSANIPGPRREKRRSTRIQCSIPAELTGTQNYPVRGEITDISLSGFYFATPGALPMGSIVSIKLSLSGQKWLAKGMVRTCDPGLGNGIEFSQMDRTSKEQLEKFLKTVPKQPSF